MTIEPDSPEGRVMADLISEAARDVQREKALNIARKGQGLAKYSQKSLIVWADAAHTAVSKPDKEDLPRIFKRVRELCSERGVEPFSEADEQAILERVGEGH